MQPNSEKPLTRGQTNALYGLVILALLAGDGYSFYWVRTHTRAPLWGELLMFLPGIFVLWLLWTGWKCAKNNEKPLPHLFSLPLFITALLIAFYISGHTSKYLVLICFYGLSTVQSEHLHFILTDKLQPWVVSNGDHMPEAYHLWGLVSGEVIAIVFFSIFIPIYHLLPKRNADGSGSISFTIYRREKIVRIKPKRPDEN